MSSKQALARLLAALLCASAFVMADQGQLPADTYTIGPQDVLSVTCFNDPTISGKFIVPPDGFIGFSLIGSVKVSGLTVREVEAVLKTRFQEGGFLANPSISVTVDQFKSQKVMIQGEVRSPGQYALTGGLNLLELIAQAGSMLTTASGEVLIVRQTGDKQDFLSADLSQLQNGVSAAAIPLRNGDLVIVQQADRAYILGEVKSPNAYPVRRETTLLQLLSLAGGPTADAATGRIKIIRTVNGKQTEIKNAKMTEIVKPGDTVVVPVRYF